MQAAIDTLAANNVTYDNTSSGLTAANVQAAIDELNTNDVGKKEYVSNAVTGEIFNTYEGVHKNSAVGTAAHAEGYHTSASSNYAHAEGYYTAASNTAAHAEGSYSVASGVYSHAGGRETIANLEAMTAIGKFNKSATAGSNTLFVIGNGASTGTRSNIVEVDTTSLNINGDIK